MNFMIDQTITSIQKLGNQYLQINCGNEVAITLDGRVAQLTNHPLFFHADRDDFELALLMDLLIGAQIKKVEDHGHGQVWYFSNGQKFAFDVHAVYASEDLNS